MGNAIQLRGTNGAVKVHVLDYENPDAEDTSDANWLRCIASVEVDSFSASLPVAATTADFEEFERELSRLVAELRGRAALVTDEDTIRLTVSALAGGRAQVEGALSTAGGPKAVLSFAFESDQSWLRSALEGLREVVTHFPVKRWA